jgi:hypothetical protein
MAANPSDGLLALNADANATNIQFQIAYLYKALTAHLGT